MLIALHQSHHWLPFSDKPRQPKELFEPKCHGNMKVVVAGEKLLARHTRLWPVLAGLHAVDLQVMAHVAAFCGRTGEGGYRYCKPLWIQVTTLSEQLDHRSIPLVIKKGELKVEHIWMGSDEPNDPYQFLVRETLLPGSAGHSSHYWTDFFLERLAPAITTLRGTVAEKTEEGPTRRVTMPA